MYKYNKEDLVKQIAKHEGVVLKVYKDSLGIDTIGIGRNLEHRGISDDELNHMGKTIEEIHENGITLEDAYYLADKDIEIVESELGDSWGLVEDLDATRQRVLVDMAFNLGMPRLNKFNCMWSHIEDKNYANASAEMLNSRWAKQVKSRATTLSYAMEHGEFA